MTQVLKFLRVLALTKNGLRHLVKIEGKVQNGGFYIFMAAPSVGFKFKSKQDALTGKAPVLSFTESNTSVCHGHL